MFYSSVSAQLKFPFDIPTVDTIFMSGCLYSYSTKQNLENGQGAVLFIPNFSDKIECEKIAHSDLIDIENRRDFLCYLSKGMSAFNATDYFRNRLNYTRLDYSSFFVKNEDWDYKSKRLKVKKSYVTFRAWRYKMSVPQVGEFLNLNDYRFKSDSTTVYILREVVSTN